MSTSQGAACNGSLRLQRQQARHSGPWKGRVQRSENMDIPAANRAESGDRHPTASAAKFLEPAAHRSLLIDEAFEERQQPLTDDLAG